MSGWRGSDKVFGERERRKSKKEASPSQKIDDSFWVFNFATTEIEP